MILRKLKTFQISKGEKSMKKLMMFSLLIVTFFSGCTTQQKTTGYTYDDVYSNQSKSSKDPSNSKIKSNDLASSNRVVTADSSTKSTKVASSVDYSSNSYATKVKISNGNNAGQISTISSDSTSSSGGSSPNVNLYLGDSWGYPYWSPYY
jgi:cytoskeletal protein RodZ